MTSGMTKAYYCMAAYGPPPTDEAISGINVTPLVDITLVLLIIFMVTAKMTFSQAIAFDPPKVAPSSATAMPGVLSIVVTSDGAMSVDGKAASDDDAFLGLAREARRGDADVRAVIKADAAAAHGRVIHVLDLLKRAGIARIAFGVTPVPPTSPAPRASPAIGAPPPE